MSTPDPEPETTDSDDPLAEVIKIIGGPDKIVTVIVVEDGATSGVDATEVAPPHGLTPPHRPSRSRR